MPVKRLRRYFSATQARGPKPKGAYDCVGMDAAASPNQRLTLNSFAPVQAIE